jgi:hypothetical protein
MSVALQTPAPNSFADEFSTADESPLFDRQELNQFRLEDAQAGRTIGKILTTLFIYTLTAMGIVIWWSLRTIGN